MPQFKKCKSCKSLKPFDCFGYLNSAKDGFNPSCKDCRCYIRNKSYEKSKNKPTDRYPLPPDKPLKYYNIDMLESIIDLSKNFKAIITTKEVNSDTQYKIIVESDKSSCSQEYFQFNKLLQRIEFWVKPKTEYFIEHLAQHLYEKELKVIIIEMETLLT